MSYLAISRKYRPATFDEIVGQEHVTRTLRNALQRDRIHHAFLFTGARGVGKTTAARALSRSLNCVNGPTPEPCGTCTSCTEIGAGMSPDLIEIDGASNNSVEDVRELRETVRYAPTRGGWKIYLIDEVHMLSKGAFNALLKTLEEPPPHVVFIFATTEPNRIPDTILSRVQRFDFKRIPVAAVTKRLRTIADQESVTISDEGLRLIAGAGEGSMRDAESLLDQVIAFAGSDVSAAQVVETLGLIDRSLLHETLRGLVTGEPDRCLDAIDRVYAYGYELAQFTAELLDVLRNATFLRLSKGVRRHVDLSAEEVEQLDGIVADVDPEVLTRTFTAMLELHDQVSRSQRPRIVLEMGVARLATVRPVQPIGGLVERLESLEQRLRQQGTPGPIPGMKGAGRGGPPRRTPPPSDAPVSTGGRAVGPAARSDTRERRSSPSRGTQAKGNDDPYSSGDGPPAPPVGRDASQPPEPPPPEPWEVGASPPSASDPGPADEPSPVPSRPRMASQDSALPTTTTAAAVDAERWRRFRSAVGDNALTRGEPEHLGTTLTVVVPSRRDEAEARMCGRSPDVDEALSRCYPQGTSLEIVTRSKPVSPDAARAESLRREVLANPDVRRIIDALQADVTNIIPLDTGEPS